jgi:hypothetical protein
MTGMASPTTERKDLVLGGSSGISAFALYTKSTFVFV